MNRIQIIVGYLILLSLFELVLYSAPSLLSLCLFFTFILFVKVTPHPTSHLNPFAFGIRLRKKY